MKNSKKNKNIISFVVVIIAVLAIFAFINKSDVSDNKTLSVTNFDDLVISKSDTGKEAVFYPYESENGTYMELLAFKASDGTIRTALNTCQICYNSGYGYYIQEGDVLVCQNCGNRYPADMVGLEKGGCNPIPIFDNEKTETEQTITITKEVVESYSKYFEFWNKEA